MEHGPVFTSADFNTVVRTLNPAAPLNGSRIASAEPVLGLAEGKTRGLRLPG